jgi:cytochrome d ubiquinol oxidase subunit II
MGLPEIIAAVMLASLVIYCVMAGADFGGGVWELLASGPRATQQRELVFKAIGPIWEANHVWLILIIVLTFVCFPAAFAAVSIALHIPLALMLIGIVLRGSAFAFRNYEERSVSVQRRWALVFAISSAFTPVMLGVCLGAATSGDILIRDGTVATGFFKSWLQPFPWAVGFFTLSLFSYLAAVYLACEARDPDLKDDFRRKAIASGIAVGVLAFVVLGVSRTGAPQLWTALVHQPTAWPAQIITGTLAVAALYMLWKKEVITARLFAVLQVVAILIAWGIAEHPFLVRPEITIRSAAAEPGVLAAVAWALLAGAVILFPSLFYLYRVFKGRHAFAVTDESARS